MKKLLALFHEKSAATSSSVLDVAKAGPFELDGIFLQERKSSIDFQYPLLNDISVVQSSFFDDRTERENMEIEKHKLRLIKHEFAAEGLPFETGCLHESSLRKLVEVSAGADLMMFDANMNLSEYLHTPMNVSMEDVLVKASCPLYLFTKQEATVQKVILAYDGSPSSLYAIRMYRNLFRGWKNLPTVLLSLNITGTQPKHNRQMLDDGLRKHFGHFDTETQDGELRVELVNYIQQQTADVLVVTGCEGGEALSRKFHRNLGSIVLKQTRASVFITHQS
jgi:hypothetical protein